ncbi:MAG: DUF1934 domain-containing protein [Lachnospiraceae bacterium]|nr:DUF1934 domain-containing protein [Lachnospiraceae bacterium]
MNKEVLLSIRGLHYSTDFDDSTPVEIITPAEYYTRNGKHYILYNELNEDHTGNTKTKIKIADDYVEISKNGASSTNMLFEKGKKNLTCYSTPFGSLMLAVNTSHIAFSQEQSQLSLKIDYLLEANYEPVADCKLELHVTEKDASLFSLEQ